MDSYSMKTLTLKRIKTLGLVGAAAAYLTACGSSFMEKHTDDRQTALLQLTSGDDGQVSASLSANSSTTQVLQTQGDSTIKGSALALPPGALAIDVDITIQEAASLVSDSVSTNLGIPDAEITAAGPAVEFAPSQAVEASSPFTLAIPLSGTSLNLVDNTDNIVVIYKATAVSSGKSSLLLGIIPTSSLTIANGLVSFSTTRFGAFQVAKSSVAVTEPKSAPTYDPIVAKSSSSNVLVGRWLGKCHQNGDSKDQDYYIDSVQFSASTFSYTENRYASSTCTGTFKSQGQATGTYVIGDAVSTEPGANKIDITFSSYAEAFGTDTEVSYANKYGYCGLTNWATGVPQDVMGLDCTDPNNPNSGDDAPQSQMYEIFKVENGTLRFGNSDNIDNSIEANRPTTLESSTNAMTKQS